METKERSRPTSSKRPDRFLILGGLLLASGLVVVLANLAGEQALPTPHSARPSSEHPVPTTEVLLDIEGEGDTFSEQFETNENWELRWEADGGGPFTVELFTDDDASRGTIVEAGKRDERLNIRQ